MTSEHQPGPELWGATVKLTVHLSALLLEIPNGQIYGDKVIAGSPGETVYERLRPPTPPPGAGRAEQQSHQGTGG